MSQLHPVNKILITNIVSLNTGDAAILSGTIDILHKKYGSNVEVIVFDKCADVAKKYYPWATFRQSLFPCATKGFIYRALKKRGYSHWVERLRFLRFYISVYFLKNKLSLFTRILLSKSEIERLNEYVTADLIFSTGGTYLIEDYNLSPAIMDYRISMLSGARFGFFTQTLGPFKDKKHQSIFKSVFSKASVILLRDERSKNHILELGCSGNNIYLAADAAFVLAQKTKHLKVNSGHVHQTDSELKVAISVRSIKNLHASVSEMYYKAMVQSVVIAVSEFGAKVTFLSTCQGIDEYWTHDDKIADEIYTLIPEGIRQYVEVDRKFRQPLEIVNKYQSFDAVIATRMHATILSLCAGVPTLGVAYGFKTEELFKNIEMEELLINVSSFTLDEVTDCVQRLLSNRDLYKSKVAKAAEIMCQKAWSVESALPEINNEKI